MTKIIQAKYQLQQLVPGKEDKLKTMMETAYIITDLMAPYSRKDAYPIVVGGLSVEIYTQGDYTTRDIDIVTSSSIGLRELLLQIDFKKEGRIFYHEDIEVAIDVVDNFLAGSYDRITKLEIAAGKNIYVISIEDIILDRLRDYEHDESRHWGFMLLSDHFEKVDLKYLKEHVENKNESEELARWIKAIEDVT